MGKRGPAATPNLQVVKEGNPGHHSTERLEAGVKVESVAPDEPDWTQWWPPVRVPTKTQLEKRHSRELIEGELAHKTAELADEKRASLVDARRAWLIARDRDQAQRSQKSGRRCREIARRTWRRVVPVLDRQGLLTLLDTDVLTQLCITTARIDECERNISEFGIWQRGERGVQKTPATTVVGQYRRTFQWCVGELGLSPVARDGLSPGSGDGDEDLLD